MDISKRIEVVSASRLGKEAFWKTSALGQSLLRMRHLPLVANIHYNNSTGLPQLYNVALEAKDCEDLVLFIHDDVWIDDYHLNIRLIEAFERFDVVGVAGNRRVPPHHVGWAFLRSIQEVDERQNLSGAVAHGERPFSPIDAWGPCGPCELLDGVFIAVNRKRLVETSARFDPQFPFHFYDLDFCRSARRAGLKVGTWPIAITHQSHGNYTSESWTRAEATYASKWREFGGFT